jgi:hypothetical protein
MKTVKTEEKNVERWHSWCLFWLYKLPICRFEQLTRSAFSSLLGEVLSLMNGTFESLMCLWRCMRQVVVSLLISSVTSGFPPWSVWMDSLVGFVAKGPWEAFLASCIVRLGYFAVLFICIGYIVFNNSLITVCTHEFDYLLPTQYHYRLLDNDLTLSQNGILVKLITVCAVFVKVS